jgi:hypothetical protein
MRRLHLAAREHYDGLAVVPSWSRLVAAYFFDPRYGVQQYVGASNEYLEEAPARSSAQLTEI